MTKDDNSQTPWKNRRMKGGDWTDDAKSDKPQRADRTVPVKMTVDELAEFDAAIAGLGLKGTARCGSQPAGSPDLWRLIPRRWPS